MYCVCAGGLTRAWSKHLLNYLVPEGACTASRDSLGETSDWLDIEVRRWHTKVMPHAVFLVQLGSDNKAVGRTTHQIRWQFSTGSNCCCSKGGPDKINQALEWFSHSSFLPLPVPLPFPLSFPLPLPFFFFCEDTTCLLNTNLGSTCGIPYHPCSKMRGLIYGLDHWKTVILHSLWCFVRRCSTLQSKKRDFSWVFRMRSVCVCVCVFENTAAPVTQQLIRHWHINHVTGIESNRARQQVFKPAS